MKTIMKTSAKTSTGFDYEKLYTILYYGLFSVIVLTLIFVQPFGDPPDEINRCRIADYICKYGILPNGYDAEVLIPGYGFSYAFQPILPYMVQGYFMRFISLFTQDWQMLHLAARLVNFVAGLFFAYFVRKIGKALFQSALTGWLFSVLVVFLPQSIFMHSFINTDSFVLLSSAIMIYCWIIGLQKGCDGRLCILLAIGISICALSYYNAYGLILCSMFLFVGFFYKKDSKKMDWKGLLKYAALTACLVLVCISWWFIRSTLLYNGDFLGMASRTACARLYADPAYHPDTRVTFLSSGVSPFGMLQQTSYCDTLFLSFVAAFGPMNVMSSIWVYRFFKVLFLSGLLGYLFIYTKNYKNTVLSAWSFRLLKTALIVSAIIVQILCFYYSYTTDYQPQGRYLMPGLVCFMLLLTFGFEKWNGLLLTLADKTGKKIFSFLPILYQIGLIILIVLSLLLTIYGYVVPHYIG